jgi:uncharacterized membrane protein (DUF2068 family)
VNGPDDVRAVLAGGDPATLGLVRDTGPGSGIVSVIGFFKLVKGAILVTLGLWALVGGHEHLAHALAGLTHWTGVFSGREVVQRALARLLALDDSQIHRLGVASLAYAAIFAVEGVGLLMKLSWAEWLTVGVTGSFVPLEVYELIHRPGPGKLAALVINLAIVAILARRRLDARREPEAT